MATDSATINVVQITLWMNENSQRLIVKANAGARNPATGNSPGWIFDGNIEEDEGTIRLAQDILGKLLVAYPAGQTISISVDDDEIVPPELGNGPSVSAASVPSKPMSEKECQQLQDIIAVWRQIPFGLRTNISSLIKNIAKES